MAEIRLQKKIKAKLIETFYLFLENRSKRILMLYGGAGSGKSHSIAQKLIQRFYAEPDTRTLILRKTLPALRITAYRLIRDLLSEYQLPFKLNKSEMRIEHPDNGSELLFKSLDDPEKIKSYEGNYLWVEEATEIAYQDFMQLNLRLRRKNPYGINQIYLSFNPVSAFHWLNVELIQKGRTDIAIHHSTYKNNPFLAPEYIAEIEDLIHQDENFWKIYGLGEWGVLKHTVFTNYDVVDALCENPDETFYGLDFGYNAPSALVEIVMKDEECWLRERLYQTKLTNQDLIAKLKPMDIKGAIFCDCAEPARIRELIQAGFKAKPADKGKNSVKDGLDFVKRKKLHITSDSTNLLEEIRGYKYKENKDGDASDEPVKFRDHLMDALRYGIYTGLKRARPSLTWL